jgi:hypothetical protein
MLFFGRSTKQGYTQSQLVEILDEYQPSVSNLTRGKIAKVSVEKLLAYSDRLKMKTSLIVGAGSGAPAIATPEFVPVTGAFQRARSVISGSSASGGSWLDHCGGRRAGFRTSAWLDQGAECPRWALALSPRSSSTARRPQKYLVRAASAQRQEFPPPPISPETPPRAPAPASDRATPSRDSSRSG